MLPQEIIDHICMFMPLEKAWYISRYAAVKLYDPETHDCQYWVINTSDKNNTVLEYFLKHNLMSSVEKDELCCRACCYGKINILQLLLKYGMDPKNNNFSLQAAGANDQLDALKFILGLGHTLNEESKESSIFQLIVGRGRYNAVEFLLKNNHYNMKNDLWSLCYAHGQDRIDIVKLLLAYGCDLTLNENKNAIVIASSNGNIEYVKLFLKYGADPTYRDNDAIKSAQKNNHLKVVQLLLGHGCNL